MCKMSLNVYLVLEMSEKIFLYLSLGFIISHVDGISSNFVNSLKCLFIPYILRIDVYNKINTTIIFLSALL